MKILIVTDDHQLEDTLDLMLRAAGHSVVATDSGEDAVSLLRTYSCDAALICDSTIDLTPTMTVRQIRDAKMPVPILLLSTDSSVDRKCRMFNLGADDYLLLPFHRDELLARLTAIVRRAEGAASNVIEVGPLSVDFGRGQVTAFGRQMRFTHTERRIVEVLARRGGSTVSKEVLMNVLYDDRPEDPEIKIIDVYVCKIRKKLKEAGVPNLILTAWGQGYRMEAPAPTAAAA